MKFFSKLYRGIIFLFLIKSLYAEENTAEPPLAYTLLVDGKAIKLQGGKEVVIKGELKDPKVKLVPSKVRTFNYGSVTFQYPANFAFEADLSEEVNIWTMDGNDIILMLYEFSEEGISSEALANILMKEYGKGAKVTPVHLTLNGVEYKCHKVDANVVNVKLFQIVVSLPSKLGSNLFVIQDFPLEEKINGKETELVMSLLKKTFKIK